jgi:[histone H4]-N-methyl-L-lysine20 N-methyltransferase
MAKLSGEDEKDLKWNSGVRQDFSVIHSGQMKKNHLFLGPARFVNVSLLIPFYPIRVSDQNG